MFTCGADECSSQGNMSSSTPACTWPTSVKYIPSTQSKGKQKAAEKFPPESFPTARLGALTSLTLIEIDGHLEWKVLCNNQPDRPRLHASKPVTVFPPTRPDDTRLTPTTSLRQRSEEGANFLRLHLPDANVPAEILRNAITEDAEETSRLDSFGPFSRDVLAMLVMPNGRPFLIFPTGELSCDLNISPFAPGDKLIFKPTARLAHTFDTPIRQIVVLSGGPAVPIPHIAVRTFGTVEVFEVKPGSRLTSSSTLQLTSLATYTRRDVGDAHVVDILLRGSTPEVLMATERGAVWRAIDGEVLLVKPVLPGTTGPSTSSNQFWSLSHDDSDDTFICASGTSVQRVCAEASPQSQESGCTINAAHAMSLFTPRQGELVTHVDGCQADHLIRVCTTERIVWIDAQCANRPLLGYVHMRQHDRSLRVDTVRCSVHRDATTGEGVNEVASEDADGLSSLTLTLLSSPKTGLVTVYDVSVGEGGLPYVHADPYSICCWMQPYAGQTFVSLRSEEAFPASDTGLFRVMATGELQHVRLHLCARRKYTTDTAQMNPVQVEIDAPMCQWDAGVRALNREARTLQADIGPRGMQDARVVDMSAIYDYVFRERPLARREEEEKMADAVYDMLDHIPTAWKATDPPIEHILTLYDMAYRAADDPGPESTSSSSSTRSDFLATCPVNSTRGYRAVVQGRLSVGEACDTLWHHDMAWRHNILPTLRHFDADLAGDPVQLEENLRTVDQSVLRLYSSRDQSGPEDQHPRARLQQQEARQQLVVDLVLSQNLFSVSPFGRVATTSGAGAGAAGRSGAGATKTVGAQDQLDLDLESMTEALSLDGQQAPPPPPPIQFSYLHPVPVMGDNPSDSFETNVIEKMDSTGKGKTDIDEPKWEEGYNQLGIRLLLKEWDLYSHPGDYIYRDPYGNEEEDVGAKARIQGGKTGDPRRRMQTSPSPFAYTYSQPPIVTTNQPPTVAASQSLPVGATSQPHVTSFRGPLGSATGFRDTTRISKSQQEPLFSGSQHVFALGSQQVPESQFSVDMEPNTQVLPGPFGGRPTSAAARKKPPKKRMGGF
ncbi:hypothetical protein FISHEDRAFT_62656 [Fistulina hepatica ATCC 64428]|nr:hypothetical protein FISHEDRAFT_62656 [Fistulina hepatica ATCC 64428]